MIGTGSDNLRQAKLKSSFIDAYSTFSDSDHILTNFFKEELKERDEIYIHTLISSIPGYGLKLIEIIKGMVSDDGVVSLCFERENVYENYYKKNGFVFIEKYKDNDDFHNMVFFFKSDKSEEKYLSC